MERRISSYKGCLLGLAAGDGLGHGPERINGYLPVSAYTQMAAYGCNGLMLGLTRGQLTGTMAPPVRYIALALEEWADRQRWREGKVRCWISRSDRLDYRRCPEPEILDVLASGNLGTMEDHASALSGPGALMTALAAGLFYDPERLPRREIHRLGAESAALTHGDPEAFLSGAALAHIISRILFDGEVDLERLSREAGTMLLRRFGREYHDAVRRIRENLKKTRALAQTADRTEAISRLNGGKAHEVLATALYLCLTGSDDLQGTVGTAAAVSPGCGAVTGAILGAIRGEKSIPGIWLEQIECAGVLRELAEDMFRGCPMMKDSRIFDIEWDEKYNTVQLSCALHKK